MKKQNKNIKSSNNIRTTLLILFGVVLVAAGIWYVWFMPRYDMSGIPVGKVSYKFVSSRLEASLYYPGAKIFSPFGNAEDTIVYKGAIMTTDDSPENIYAWYKQWLLSHGWHADERAVPGLVSTQSSKHSYAKSNRETFEIAINNPKFLSWTLGKEVPTNKTVFEFSYLIKYK